MGITAVSSVGYVSFLSKCALWTSWRAKFFDVLGVVGVR